MSYPENLESVCIRFKRILLEYIKLSEEIIMDAGELDDINIGLNFKKYKVIKSSLNHFKREFKRNSTIQNKQDENDFYQNIYNKYIQLFIDVYNVHAIDIVSDEIDDGWLVDNNIKIWPTNNNGENLKNKKTKIGVMFCITEIYNYSLDLQPDDEESEDSDDYSDEPDIDNKYPEKCLYYLYSIFNLFCTEQDIQDIKETMEILGKQTGLLKKQQLPDFRKIFNSDNLEGIGSMAEDVLAKLEPELEEDMPEFKNLSEDEKEKRRLAARAKTRKLLKGDFLSNMVNNVTDTFTNGDGKMNMNNVATGVKSFMKNMKDIDTTTDSDSDKEDAENINKDDYEDKHNESDDEEEEEGVFDD